MLHGVSSQLYFKTCVDFTELCPKLKKKNKTGKNQVVTILSKLRQFLQKVAQCTSYLNNNMTEGLQSKSPRSMCYDNT